MKSFIKYYNSLEKELPNKFCLYNPVKSFNNNSLFPIDFNQLYTFVNIFYFYIVPYTQSFDSIIDQNKIDNFNKEIKKLFNCPSNIEVCRNLLLDIHLSCNGYFSYNLCCVYDFRLRKLADIIMSIFSILKLNRSPFAFKNYFFILYKS